MNKHGHSTRKVLGIIGAGDLGQQIAHHALEDGHYKNVKFFDDFTNSKSINGLEVLGSLSEIEQSFKSKLFDEIIIGIGYKYLGFKKELFDRLSLIVPFGKIVHSTAWVDDTAMINDGCVIYPSCTIDAKVTIGKNSVLNIGCAVAHDTSIGDHSFLSPRVAIAGFVQIGESCIIGINSTVIDNLTICSGTQIGGGTVVINSLHNAGLYVGNPARFVR